MGENRTEDLEKMIDQVTMSATAKCQNADCTVVDSGVCLEGHERYTVDCPFFRPDIVDAASEVRSDMAVERSVPAGLEQGEQRLFWSGLELGAEEVDSIMKARYGHVIGLVGPTGVGKTCYLSSLYLKAGSVTEPLSAYRFAGSLSLQGFEDRARGARTWSGGQIPQKLSERTLHQDPRQPGLMHIQVAEIDPSGSQYDLLMTDLPGEWFERLVDDASSADRLRFLARADGIFLFLDAEHLLEPDKRNDEVHRAELLTLRLVETLHVAPSTPFVIVVAKTDAVEKPIEAEFSLPGVDRVCMRAVEAGLRPKVEYTASFSRCPGVIPSGHGVEDALRAVLAPGMNAETSIGRERLLGPAPTPERHYERFSGRDIE